MGREVDEHQHELAALQDAHRQKMADMAKRHRDELAEYEERIEELEEQIQSGEEHVCLFIYLFCGVKQKIKLVTLVVFRSFCHSSDSNSSSSIARFFQTGRAAGYDSVPA